MKLVGVDVGGTFTDIILADMVRGETHVHKVPTTVEDPSMGIVQGVVELCRRVGVAPGEVTHLFHGTTIATNSILEYDGARTGMITTRGFRDIVHIARHQRPEHYSIQQEIPWQDRPLVRRRFRKVVSERLTAPKGDVAVPLDEAEVCAAVQELKAAGADSIAVCFLFSYLNPVHEERVRAIIAAEFPEAFITTSASISPQFREFERFTTAAINAFVGPKVQKYVRNLELSLTQVGMTAELRIMCSNGGVATAQSVSEKPVYTLLSGPAGGVLGGAWAGQLSNRQNLITFDVGGTSADIGIVTPRGIVESTARDTWIAGYPVLVPMIDVHTIGAGGGSIAYADAGGAFRVGPRSAGARPGPAAYGLGGQRPTVTDANVVLGRLDPENFLGGEMTIYPKLAHQVIQDLAQQLKLDLYEAAEGVVTILNNNMANAIRSRTIQKGHDPTQFSLVAFGGAGPLHGAEVAAILGIPEVLVPPHPGITSATGLLTTDLKYDLVQTEFMLSGMVDLERLNQDAAALEASIREQLLRDGVPEGQVRLVRSADCRYVGQGYELKAPVPAGELDAATMDQVWAAFHKLHEQEYGHAFPGTPIELVNLRVTGIGAMPKVGRPEVAGERSLQAAFVRTTETYFRVNGRLEMYNTNLYRRAALPVGEEIAGPAIILQKDSTTVVPPYGRFHLDEAGNILIRLEVKSQ